MLSAALSTKKISRAGFTLSMRWTFCRVMGSDCEGEYGSTVPYPAGNSQYGSAVSIVITVGRVGAVGPF